MTHHPSVAGWVTPGRPDAGKSPDLATVAPSALAAMPSCHSVPSNQRIVARADFRTLR